MCISAGAKLTGTIAVCRALRAQITRFEEAFIQLHGRPPKGATERAPLAKTYAQYREWKRAIRADAACRIQALVRSAITRWRWRHNPQVLITVTTSAARSGFAVRNDSAQGQASVLDEILIPAEIWDHRQQEVLSRAVEEALQAWVCRYKEHTRLSQQSGSNESTSDSPIPDNSTTILPAASPIASSSAERFGDLAGLSLPELEARKRQLKRKLVKYDDVFTRRNGRMPDKAEKEPIRHMYERYNALKGQIDQKTLFSSN
jgi:hypothetical protein